VDSSENWEPVIIFLRQSSFQVKVHRTQAVVIVENFSKELLLILGSTIGSKDVQGVDVTPLALLEDGKNWTSWVQERYFKFGEFSGCGF
ncbi:hypothetical protein MTR67_043615, partial [Solanum verrucosum]